MEVITIKKEEMKDGEFFLDIILGESILVKDEISQEVASNYDQEFDEEMKIEKHEFLEDGIYDISDSTYPKDEDAQSYPVCKKMKSDSQGDEFIANEGEEIKLALCKTSKNYKYCFKSHDVAKQCKTNPFKCSYCDYSCTWKSAMTIHVSAIHDKDAVLMQ